MEKENKLSAVINGKTYYLDSDNKDLLELLKDARYNKETRKQESVPYLPIATVYSLLEQFYPNYSFESRPLEIEKTYTVTKSKMNWKTKQQETIEEEVVLFKKSVTIIIPDENPSNPSRRVDGEARGVATIGMITLDQMYNGFSMKQESRAIKNALKKLGRVFRIPNDWEEIMEVDSIKSDLSITDVIKNLGTPTSPVDVVDKNQQAVEEISNDFLEKDYRELIATITEPMSITILQQLGVKLREKHGFAKGSELDEAMKKVYNNLKKEFKL